MTMCPECTRTLKGDVCPSCGYRLPKSEPDRLTEDERTTGRRGVAEAREKLKARKTKA